MRGKQSEELMALWWMDIRSVHRLGRRGIATRFCEGNNVATRIVYSCIKKLIPRHKRCLLIEQGHPELIQIKLLAAET
jgi:hypothetical protein